MIDVLRLTETYIVDVFGLRNSLKDAAEKKDEKAISALVSTLARTARRYAAVLELQNNKELFDHWQKLAAIDPDFDCDAETLEEIVRDRWMITSDFDIIVLGDDGEWRKRE